MSETWFTADCHLDHDSTRKHCGRPYATVEEMDEAIAKTWNGTVGQKDTVYVVGDFAFKNHRKWINALNGKKILIVGNHDKMPQDDLDLFRTDWTCDEVTLRDVLKTRVQFREVHQKLVRKICGQMMTLNHDPQRSWASSVHGAWMIHGHCHGRMRCSQPNNASGGLILDVGWDVFKRLLRFEEVAKEMKIKFDMMPQNFREHVLYGKPLGRNEGDDDERNG